MYPPSPNPGVKGTPTLPPDTVTLPVSTCLPVASTTLTPPLGTVTDSLNCNWTAAGTLCSRAPSAGLDAVSSAWADAGAAPQTRARLPTSTKASAKNVGCARRGRRSMGGHPDLRVDPPRTYGRQAGAATGS